MIPTAEQFIDLCFDYYYDTDHNKIAHALWERFGDMYNNDELATLIIISNNWTKGMCWR